MAFDPSWYFFLEKPSGQLPVNIRLFVPRFRFFCMIFKPNCLPLSPEIPGSFIFFPGFRDKKYQSKTKRGQMPKWTGRLCAIWIRINRARRLGVRIYNSWSFPFSPKYLTRLVMCIHVKLYLVHIYCFMLAFISTWPLEK
jgi:hypothetical protein